MKNEFEARISQGKQCLVIVETAPEKCPCVMWLSTKVLIRFFHDNDYPT